MKRMSNPRAQAKDKYEVVSELAKRRGFFWPSYEIYGGVSGFITFGPLGSLLKRRIEDKFRRFFIHRLGLYEIETSVITPAKVFEASGHVEAFKEPMVECLRCKRRFRADHLLQEFAGLSEAEAGRLSLEELRREIEAHGVRCPECDGSLGEHKLFTTMFTTTIGPYADAIGYGRPEAAQGIFTEFKRLYELARERLPFGVVQIGHALRNEISPRQGPIRLREFTIIDLEFFFDPEEDRPPLEDVRGEVLRLIPAEVRLKGSDEPLEVEVCEALKRGYIKVGWLAYFMALAKRFLVELGVPPERQRFIEKLEWERAHYSKQGFDQEIYLERWGWIEVSGHNYRTDYDLGQHMKYSNIDMRVFKEYEGRTFVEERTIIKPVLSKIRQDFKEEAQNVVKLLSGIDPNELEASLKRRGFYPLGPYGILPEHVEVARRKVEERGRRFIPHVVEPSFGSDRLTYVTLEYAYGTKGGRALLDLPRDVAPIQIGVYPLVSKNGLPEKAKEVHRMLLNEGLTVDYDESGSIGRRYARADEIGVPLGVTIDYRTLEDDTVTIRDRNTWRQVRSEIKTLPELLRAYFQYKANFDDLGKPV